MDWFHSRSSIKRQNKSKACLVSQCRNYVFFKVNGIDKLAQESRCSICKEWENTIVSVVFKILLDM